MGFGRVAGGNRDRLRGLNAADRGDVADVAQHAARNDAGAAGRIGAERQPRKLALGAHALDRALGRVVA